MSSHLRKVATTLIQNQDEKRLRNREFHDVGEMKLIGNASFYEITIGSESLFISSIDVEKCRHGLVGHIVHLNEE